MATSSQHATTNEEFPISAREPELPVAIHHQKALDQSNEVVTGGHQLALANGGVKDIQKPGLASSDGPSAHATEQPNPHVPLVPRSLVERAGATTDWHKEILCDLFLRSSGEQLRSLAGATDTSLSGCVKSRKRKTRDDGPPVASLREKTDATLRKSKTPRREFERSLSSSALTLIPYVLQNVKKWSSSGSSQEGASAAGSIVDVVHKRPDAASLSLKDLNRIVSDTFHESSVGIRATSRLSCFSDVPDSFLGTTAATSAQPPRRASPTKKKNTELRASALAVASNGEKGPEAVFAPMTLVYNECSLAAVTKWAAGKGKFNEKRAEEEERMRTMDCIMFDRPAAAPLFRQCSVCSKWGHYEIECEQLTPEQTLDVSRCTKVQVSLRGFVEEKNASLAESTSGNHLSSTIAASKREKNRNAAASQDETDASEDEYLTKSTACEFCRSGFDSENLLVCDGCDRLFHLQCLDPPLDSIPEGDWFCIRCDGYNSDVSSVVEVEGCDGFVIEQRKTPGTVEANGFLQSELGLGFPTNGWSSAVGVMKRQKGPSFVSRRKRPTVGDTRNGDVKATASEIPLAIGELCWAKRRTSPESQPGRNEWWWPSTVSSVTACKKGTKGRQTTPYVVNMYAINGAIRVRASSVLPFFQHFEEFGYNRLFDGVSNTGVDGSLFRKAVHEAISEIGCKSLWHALMKARDISGGVDVARSKTGKIARGALTEGDQDEWDEAEATEEGGFMLLSRSDPSLVAPPTAQDTELIIEEKNGASTEGPDFMPRNAAEGENGTASSAEASSRPLEIAGCVVAWCSPWETGCMETVASANASASRASALNEPWMQLGVVLSVDYIQGKALVRPLPEIEDILASSRTVAETRPSRWRTRLRSCSVAASVWLKTENLHLVGESAPSGIQSIFSKDVASRLEEERECLKCQRQEVLSRRNDGRVELVQVPPEICISPDSDADRKQSEKSGMPRTEQVRKDVSEDKRPPQDLDLPESEMEGRKSVAGEGDRAMADANDDGSNENPSSSDIEKMYSTESKGINGYASGVQRVAETPAEGRVDEGTKACERCRLGPQCHRSHDPTCTKSLYFEKPVNEASVNGEPVSELEGSKVKNRNEHPVSFQQPSKNVEKICSIDSSGNKTAEPSTSETNPESDGFTSKGNSSDGQPEVAGEMTAVNEKKLSSEVKGSRSVEETTDDSKPAGKADGSGENHVAVEQSRESEPEGGKDFTGAAPADVAEESSEDIEMLPATESSRHSDAEEAKTYAKPESHQEHPKTANQPSENIDTTETKSTELSEDIENMPAIESIRSSYVEKAKSCDKPESHQEQPKAANQPSKNILSIDTTETKTTAEQKSDEESGAEDTLPSKKPKRPRFTVEDSDDEPLGNDSTHAAESKARGSRLQSAGDASNNGNLPASYQNGTISNDGDEGGLASAKQPMRKLKKLRKRPSSKAKRRNDTEAGASASDLEDSSVETVEASTPTSTREQEEMSPNGLLTKSMFGEDVYQAERIRDERVVGSGTSKTKEYLIKWKGYPVSESTWEPEENILNPNFLRIYRAEKLLKKLKKATQAKQKGSVTSRVIHALKRGCKLLAVATQESKEILCPFCDNRFRADGLSFMVHTRMHCGEPNFAIIEEAAKLARADWFGS